MWYVNKQSLSLTRLCYRLWKYILRIILETDKKVYMIFVEVIDKTVTNSLKPSDAYMRQQCLPILFEILVFARLTPPRHFNQWWYIGNWYLINKFQWNLN